MGWLGRVIQRPGVPQGAGGTVGVAAGGTSFSGVADDESRGVRPLPQGAGLYEFWTASGKHVWLHDMDFRGFTYTASPSPQLRISFDWGDAPVPDSYAGPTVEFTFEDVRMIQWEEACDEEDRVHLGQVAAFDYSNGVFTLTTLTLSLSFSAVTCRMELLD